MPLDINNIASMNELAVLKDVTRRTIYNWLKRGDAPEHRRVGNRYIFNREAWLAFEPPPITGRPKKRT